ncbi:flagellar basal body P-ring formation chaperone FlgA [Photobacterium leiognathi]|uniref:flagellar basal body P-ring formation chaperone FlgA n=1 Tax=Photobacterium leiognathi TaxID=553611 RepID=UPI0029825804|nr:flagellar basal body P-ring formation chaperone FlgA [Photobacterium leiognathi]
MYQLLYLFNFIPFLLISLPIAVYAKDNQQTPMNYLSEYLISQKYDNFVISALGGDPYLKPGYEVKDVECIFKINRCKVTSQNINRKKITYWFKVRNPQLGWKPIKRITAGSKVTMSDFRWGMTDAFFCSNDLAEYSALNMSAKTLVNLKKDKPLCKFDLMTVDDVSKGEIVLLIGTTNTFEVKIKVKALKAGSVGDVIPVRIPGSASILNGIIIEKGKVELLK